MSGQPGPPTVPATTSPACLLETRDLAKSFGGLHVLDGLNLSVATGSIRCLIGPNGSGKSTLLKAIVGLHRPDRGEIRFDDHRIDGLRPFEIIRRGISIKFQIVSIYRELSVYQNLRVPTQRRIAGEARRRAAIGDMLELIGLHRHANAIAGTLSHGQQQWLEIAMAIANEPRLLILDEPTAGMTPEETQQTADIVLRLNRDRGIAAIVVEHDMNFVRYIDQPVSVLHQGRIFFEGDLDAVKSNPDIERIYFGARR
jgi:ABC-type uncharacterized transport system ATPase subunit